MVENAQRLEWIAENILPYEQELRRWLRNFSGIEADDIVQESYAILMDGETGHIQSPQAYLFTVARRLILQHHRRAKIISIVALAEIDASGINQDEPSIEEVVGARQDLARLHSMLASLPERCRDVLLLRKIEGWSQRKVASHLRISENVVEKQLARALRLLGQSFAHRVPDRHGTAGHEKAALVRIDRARRH